MSSSRLAHDRLRAQMPDGLTDRLIAVGSDDDDEHVALWERCIHLSVPSCEIGKLDDGRRCRCVQVCNN